jgi:hypothetical protein
MLVWLKGPPGKPVFVAYPAGLSLTVREHLDRDTLQQRRLLC